jgi:hypothetical protein
MSIVIPASKILEVVNQPSFIETRRAVADQYKKEKLAAEAPPSQESEVENEEKSEEKPNE